MKENVKKVKKAKEKIKLDKEPAKPGQSQSQNQATCRPALQKADNKLSRLTRAANSQEDVKMAATKRPVTLHERNLKMVDELFQDCKVEEVLKNSKTRDLLGLAPLSIISAMGHKVGVEKLLEAGVDVNQPAEADGSTPVMMAARSKHPDIVECLLKHGADISIRNRDGDNALMVAARVRDPKTFNSMWAHRGVIDINQTNKVGDTLLHIAAQMSWESCIQFLAPQGARTDIQNQDGQTPLIIAAAVGDKKTVDALLRAGSDLLMEDTTGRTAICRATEAEKEDIITVLLKRVSHSDATVLVKSRVDRLSQPLVKAEEMPCYLNKTIFRLFQEMAKHTSYRDLMYKYKVIPHTLVTIHPMLGDMKVFMAACSMFSMLMYHMATYVENRFAVQFIKSNGPDMVIRALKLYTAHKEHATNPNESGLCFLPLLGMCEVDSGRDWLTIHWAKVLPFSREFGICFECIEFPDDRWKQKADRLWIRFREFFDDILTQQTDYQSAMLLEEEEREKERREKRREKRRQKRQKQTLSKVDSTNTVLQPVKLPSATEGLLKKIKTLFTGGENHSSEKQTDKESPSIETPINLISPCKPTLAKAVVETMPNLCKIRNAPNTHPAHVPCFNDDPWIEVSSRKPLTKAPALPNESSNKLTNHNTTTSVRKGNKPKLPNKTTENYRRRKEGQCSNNHRQHRNSNGSYDEEFPSLGNRRQNSRNGLKYSGSNSVWTGSRSKSNHKLGDYSVPPTDTGMFDDSNSIVSSETSSSLDSTALNIQIECRQGEGWSDVHDDNSNQDVHIMANDESRHGVVRSSSHTNTRSETMPTEQSQLDNKPTIAGIVTKLFPDVFCGSRKTIDTNNIDSNVSHRDAKQLIYLDKLSEKSDCQKPLNSQNTEIPEDSKQPNIYASFGKQPHPPDRINKAHTKNQNPHIQIDTAKDIHHPATLNNAKLHSVSTNAESHSYDTTGHPMFTRHQINGQCSKQPVDENLLDKMCIRNNCMDNELSNDNSNAYDIPSQGQINSEENNTFTTGPKPCSSKNSGKQATSFPEANKYWEQTPSLNDPEVHNLRSVKPDSSAKLHQQINSFPQVGPIYTTANVNVPHPPMTTQPLMSMTTNKSVCEDTTELTTKLKDFISSTMQQSDNPMDCPFNCKTSNTTASDSYLDSKDAQSDEININLPTSTCQDYCQDWPEVISTGQPLDSSCKENYQNTDMQYEENWADEFPDCGSQFAQTETFYREPSKDTWEPNIIGAHLSESCTDSFGNKGNNFYYNDLNFGTERPPSPDVLFMEDDEKQGSDNNSQKSEEQLNTFPSFHTALNSFSHSGQIDQNNLDAVEFLKLEQMKRAYMELSANIDRPDEPLFSDFYYYKSTLSPVAQSFLEEFMQNVNNDRASMKAKMLPVKNGRNSLLSGLGRGLGQNSLLSAALGNHKPQQPHSSDIKWSQQSSRWRVKMHKLLDIVKHFGGRKVGNIILPNNGGEFSLIPGSDRTMLGVLTDGTEVAVKRMRLDEIPHRFPGASTLNTSAKAQHFIASYKFAAVCISNLTRRLLYILKLIHLEDVAGPAFPENCTVMPRPSLGKLHPHLTRVGINRSLNSMTINFQKTIQAFEALNQYCYIATELIEYNLVEYLRITNLNHSRDPIGTARLVFQLLKGLYYLHDTRRMPHGNLKPENVMVDSCGTLKLMDYGQRRSIDCRINEANKQDGQEFDGRCWRPSEMFIPGIEYTHKSDIQVAGMLVHYILTGGRHPYGRTANEIEAGICRQWPKLVYVTEEANDLVIQMISLLPSSRPFVLECLMHPFFWAEEKKFRFLVIIGSDLLKELKNSTGGTPITDHLSAIPLHVVQQDWLQEIEPALMIQMSTFRHYRNTVPELILFAYNCCLHYETLGVTAQAVLEDPARYFQAKFPMLFMAIYRVLRQSEIIANKTPYRHFFRALA